MLEIKCFTFNAFQENTYILSDAITKECIIIDPGCSNTHEDNELISYISNQGLKPQRLINTHCHIDHILGNHLVSEKYGLSLEGHELEIPVLASGRQVSMMYGIPYKESPEMTFFHKEGASFVFAGTKIEIYLTPGHSPGSICLNLPEQKEVIAGDVLLQGSIGRTDLPGGDYETLIRSIKTKLLSLPNETVVHPGHGPSTTIEKERKTNPFLQ